MKKTTKSNEATNKMSNKYWEAENPIITETPTAVIKFYENAGKIQLFPTYEKDGEVHLGRACVWDNNEIDADDAVALVYGLMSALLDCGVENEAYTDAYNLLKDEYDSTEEAIEQELDSEFKDDVENETTDEEEYEYSEMSVKELKTLCFEREIEVPKMPAKKQKAKLIELLESYDAEESDEEDEENEIDIKSLLIEADTSLVKEIYEELIEEYKGRFNKSKAIEAIIHECEESDILEYFDEDDEESDTSYSGKNLVFADGKYDKANKKVKDSYIEWCDDASEWVEYIIEQSEEIGKMPTKTQKQKKAQDKVYAELREEVADWLNAWDEDESTNDKVVEKVSGIADDLILGKVTDYDVAMVQFIEVIDKLKLS